MNLTWFEEDLILENQEHKKELEKTNQKTFWQTIQIGML